MLTGITTSEAADRLSSPPDVIVKSVLSVSMCSPPSPNFKPTAFGMCTSVVAVRFIFPPELKVKSVSSDSIFSLALSSNTRPLFLGI